MLTIKQLVDKFDALCFLLLNWDVFHKTWSENKEYWKDVYKL